MRFQPGGPLRGELRPPPDKSISHRAALLAAMADGRSQIEDYLAAADTRSTLFAVETLGAKVTAKQTGEGRQAVEIEGAGLRGAGPAEIDVGNAGTLLRVLPGWLAGQPDGVWRLDGDASIRSRPVDRIAEPLREMGAAITCRGGQFPPLDLEGADLRGIAYEPPVASAQVKSCLLLAGLLAEGETAVLEPIPTRDHTERMLGARGIQLDRRGKVVTVRPADVVEPADVRVPGDFSSAAFALVAALVVPGSEVVLSGAGLNPTRTGLLTIAKRMGAAVETEWDGEPGGEPVGTIVAKHSELSATSVGAEEVPLAIDELPLVGLLGCFAEGETVVSGAEELRAKESDRIAGVVEGLAALGAEIEARPDGFAVQGTGGLRGGALDAGGDHRMAMLGAVAGIASADGVEVEGFDAAAVSYPGFEADLRSLLGSR